MSIAIVHVPYQGNWRKSYQNFMGLTNEQMSRIEVHHRYHRSSGASDHPSQLVGISPLGHQKVYHPESEFTKWAKEGGKKGGVVRGKQLAENPSLKDVENAKSMQVASVKAKRSKWPEWAWNKVREGVESGKWHWGAKDLISRGISPKQIANMQKIIKQGFSFEQAVNLEDLK